VTDLYYVFRDSPLRRSALSAERGAAVRYSLFGLDQLSARGHRTRHNLERGGTPPAWAAAAGGALKRLLEGAGGYGGDFATVLASVREMNRADVVFSTVDTVGIPLLLAKKAGVLRAPLVYAAIGLPERLERLRNARMRRLYASALASTAAVLTYSEHEAAVLREWLAARGKTARVEFVPFGVDTAAFAPEDRAPSVDVVSVGGDPHRDYELLLRVADAMPASRFLLVTDAERARSLPPASTNVEVLADVPFDAMRELLAGARVVALPVRDNSYSGATTVLLQALALGKPVVVSRTKAIATGYGLVDRENCRLVAPGDVEAFRLALASVLRDEREAHALGAGARATVERDLTWEQYVTRIERLLLVASGAPAPSRSEAS
jgi:glycosyltransferase involved in cell wall biosynthesis